MRVFWRVLVAIGGIVLGASAAYAQGIPQSLVQLTAGNPAFDPLEQAAAAANQSVFNALFGPCNGGSGPGCTAQQFQIFDEVRELVATADEIRTGNPNPSSLGLNEQQLGDAL